MGTLLQMLRLFSPLKKSTKLNLGISQTGPTAWRIVLERLVDGNF
jgi:hypothetical protein